MRCCLEFSIDSGNTALRGDIREGDAISVIFRRKVPGVSAAALAKFVASASRAAGLAGSVQVLVAGDRELLSLNKRFRRKKVPTDVLSFPAPAALQPRFAGDIAISAQIAARSARRLGHSVGEELRILVLHGVLHLAGYDHEQDHGEMSREEMRLRRLLALPSGLIERSSSSVRLRSAWTRTRSSKQVGPARPSAKAKRLKVGTAP